MFITISTRFWLEPFRDGDTILIRACELWITVVDWVTPFSLLYLYKHIGGIKTKKETKYRNDQDSSVGIESIKMLLELQDEFKEAGSQQNSLNS